MIKGEGKWSTKLYQILSSGSPPVNHLDVSGRQWCNTVYFRRLGAHSHEPNFETQDPENSTHGSTQELCRSETMLDLILPISVHLQGFGLGDPGIMTASTVAFLWRKTKTSKKTTQIQNMKGHPAAASPISLYYNADRQLESFPQQPLSQCINVHYCERPDLKRFLFDCKRVKHCGSCLRSKEA
ncbi:ferric reduction oxidase 2-like [Dorcoceras hygrometricum]|uniref:Ferric reduction oxidase 2-like n=1 Tax=Dorcoceras hygrometricum TaxID=472368 RepID=A0A2Z7BZG6_9LAMI|nr:ferric reduction oxidase 2-like [Dorcoceras hygrometricum]